MKILNVKILLPLNLNKIQLVVLFLVFFLALAAIIIRVKKYDSLVSTAILTY